MSIELIGYADKFSVAPGERIRFMVSTDLPSYTATLVRLIHGDRNPDGPGSKEELVPTAISGEYPGRKQIAYPGSYILVPDAPALRQLQSSTLQTWVYPTRHNIGNLDGLITRWSPEKGVGFGLFIGESGDLEFRMGDGEGIAERVSTGKQLSTHRWYFCAATFDATRGECRLYQQPIQAGFSREEAVITVKSITPPRASLGEAPLLLAAAYLDALANGRKVGRGCYNGKLDRPCLYSRALGPAEIDSLYQGVAPQVVDSANLVAVWDFAQGISSNRVADTSLNHLDGTAINMPMRAVTGRNWQGTEYDYKHAPEQYGAIYFHDDDLEDAQWDADFELTVPDPIKSGVYAARLTAHAQTDYIPFVVRPKRGEATASILYLLPTMTYLAYANDHADSATEIETGAGDGQIVRDPYDLYLDGHPEFAMSIYDRHSDGSGCCYSSRLRPIVNMRPQYRMWIVNAPRHFPADLYLIDWLEAKDLAYDVVTDEDLHLEGQALLSQYRVVVTGTHPEYWTTPMLNAAEDFLNAGGRLMYLGGNGFYWVTSVDAERSHIVEVRRGNAGSRAWNSAPGEAYHSTSGELGGLWLHRGRPPNRLAGIGFTSMGWDSHSPGYVRRPESLDPRAAFIFEGVPQGEVIGDFGLVLGGAAGDELDRFNVNLGSPRHALVLASSTGHSHFYQPVIEDFLQITGRLQAIGQANIHADMVYFETPHDGAVFSVGSICWCGSLSHNNYDNNVSRITENVLRRFMA